MIPPVRALPLLWLMLAGSSAAVEFNREIRPILSDRCFACHGPDSKNRMAGLRLDTEAGARAAIQSGKLLERVTATGPRRMPPVSAGAPLAESQIGMLRNWIAEGAPWQKHWSLEPPVRRAVPPGVHPVDHFIRARLDAEGLRPAPRARPAAVIRRLSLDLTGLPPTPAEVAEFERDPAIDRLVDRLLASPRYGERMASRWLDAARYADTNGYQTDAERFMWRWRDWVIDAFNRNLPFDQFTVEQLAGDLLPEARRDQIIATGFNRNHRGNGEGGSLDAEFLAEYAVDRVETTSTVWLGLTLGCSRCHDHKYDPFTQREFYQLFAFFNNIPEKGKVFKYGNSPPVIPAPTPDQEQELAAHDTRWQRAQTAFAHTPKPTPAALESIPATADWQPHRDLLYSHGPEIQFAGQGFTNGGNVAPYGFHDRFTLTAWIRPSQPDGAIVTRALDKDEGAGYGLYLRQGKLQVNLVQRWLDDCLRVETVAALPLDRWTHVAMSYDGTSMADGIRVYVNGVRAELKYLVDDLNQTFQTKEPLRIGGGNGLRFRGAIRDVRIYNRVVEPEEAAILAVPESAGELVRAATRNAAQQRKVEYAFFDQFGPAPVRAAWREFWDAREEREAFLRQVPTVMVMQERSAENPTFILQRGQYDRPGDRVTRLTPQALPAWPADAPRNRLGLARWIVSPQNPLTARVIVNRYWQMLFGTGLVKTVEDFGSQGEWPSHPELLDWLALEFREQGWDLKRLLKLIVTSETYLQDSRLTPELLQRDPENRLLARAPRYRWPAEMIRDQALLASGLLVEKIGGPSVKPYQPAGLWKELSGGADYQRGQGDELYRRSLYTFWKRASPPPGLMTFDSAGREACTVRESRTNTPLQALTLMNDETYLEAARKMAERLLREGGSSDEQRLTLGYRLLTSRDPQPRELAVLRASLAHHRDRYRSQPDLARQLLQQGESPVDPALDARELAAWSTIASMLLSLDEVVTKQ